MLVGENNEAGIDALLLGVLIGLDKPDDREGAVLVKGLMDEGVDNDGPLLSGGLLVEGLDSDCPLFDALVGMGEPFENEGPLLRGLVVGVVFCAVDMIPTDVSIVFEMGV